MQITGKDDLLIQKLLEFYSNPLYLNIFTEIVVQGKHISLRLLDYFSTNYSKYNKVCIRDDSTDIYTDYKQHLKGYKKQYFDPFCRRKRVVIRSKDPVIDLIKDKEQMMKQNGIQLTYEYKEDQRSGTPRSGRSKGQKCKTNLEVITTVGQLNFFKWCITKGVIQYILIHYKIIEDNMSQKYLKRQQKQMNKKIVRTKLTKHLQHLQAGIKIQRWYRSHKDKMSSYKRQVRYNITKHLEDVQYKRQYPDMYIFRRRLKTPI